MLKKFKEKNKFLLLSSIVLSTILIHIFAINESSNGREIIWEPDDQYHEIVKAQNLDSCNKNCLAINNLSSYEKNSLDLKQKNLLEILIHHTAIEYHFIKSKILIFINHFSNDWELSQIILSKVVSSLLVISFAVFILLHFNLNICLISSILALPYTTIVWGFHFSNNSSHLSSVFGIFSLIFLYKLEFKNYLISLFFSVLSIFTHPIGIFMIIFNSTYLIIKNKFFIDSKIIKYLILKILIIILYFNLDLNYINEEITFLNIYNEGFNLFELFFKNLKFNLYFFYDIFNLLNFVILFVVLFSLRGSYNIFIKKYPALLPLIASFLIIMIISFFHFAPQASILVRMQLILTLSILSLYSILIYEFLLKIKKNRNQKIYLTTLIIIFCSHSYYNLNNLFFQIKSNQETLNLSFNSNSINILKKNSGSNEPIIFKKNNSDLSVFKSIYYKFLMEGFNNKNILIGELLDDNTRKQILFRDFYLILPSPIINNNLIYKENRPNCLKINFIQECIKRGWYGFSRANMSDLLVRDNDIIKIKSKKIINKVSIYINTFGNDIFLYDMDTKKNILINTNNKFEWIELDNSNFDISSIKFKLKGNKFLKIKGIKSSQNIKYYWPWYDEISLTHINKKSIRNFNFNIKKMIGSYYCKDYNIIDDKSSFVLVELKCKDKQL
ncbi:hypothetical protein IDH05_01625 [Pelagibacterales bacterium SAG-MED27]|nr:hypothetical protein [Pelagibacterales bacterium SAG-MED27]